MQSSVVPDGCMQNLADCNIEVCTVCPEFNRRSLLRVLHLEAAHDLRYDRAERYPNAAVYNSLQMERVGVADI